MALVRRSGQPLGRHVTSTAGNVREIQRLDGTMPAPFGTVGSSVSHVICAVLMVLAIPGLAPAEPAAGQSSRTVLESEQGRTAGPDFLFGQPRVVIGLRGLWVNPRGDSDIFSFLTEQLTLQKKDFRAQGFAFDLGLPVNSRVDAIAGLEYNRARAASEDRAFIEADGTPIRQDTQLTQFNVTGSLELALVPRGRAIGQFAWIAAPVTPYIGAGGGLTWYRFEQTGDFVDSLDPELGIFEAQLLSDGWTTNTHVFGGVDIKITRRLLLSAEARYVWADATMGLDFVGFEPIDLSGLRIGGGIRLLF